MRDAKWMGLTILPLAAMVAMLGARQAVAHTGLGIGGGFAAGFEHPFLGIDHLLAMTSVGALGAVAWRDGKSWAIWALPLTFMAAMTLGGCAALAGMPLLAVEQGIALSLLVFGALLATRVGLPMPAAIAVVGLFALFHGHAHGSELPEMADASGYVAGFVTATGLLHIAGIALTFGLARMPRWSDVMIRAIGGAVAASGLVLLVS